MTDAIKFAISHHLVSKIQVFIWKTGGLLPSCGDSGDSGTDPTPHQDISRHDTLQIGTALASVGLAILSEHPLLPTLMPSRFEEKSRPNVHQESGVIVGGVMLQFI